VNAYAHPGFGKPERRGAAGDAGTDDRDVDPPFVAGENRKRDGVF
jgi:hypothetical protein